MLLNFLMPDLFSNSEVFDEWFKANQDNADILEPQKILEMNNSMTNKFKQILSIFMLRRTK